MSEKFKTIYAAGPLGFSEVGRDFHAKMLDMMKRLGFGVLDPWTLTDKKLIDYALSAKDETESKKRWEEANKIIARNNMDAIKKADMLVAVLDGVDVDSGTASEIGYACALGKLIIGYRGDFRLSADNLGAKVNLQVQGFIEESGGEIVSSIADLEKVLEKIKTS